jgi:hypothetical protein
VSVPVDLALVYMYSRRGWLEKLTGLANGYRCASERFSDLHLPYHVSNVFPDPCTPSALPERTRCVKGSFTRRVLYGITVLDSGVGFSVRASRLERARLTAISPVLAVIPSPISPCFDVSHDTSDTP